MPRFTPNLSRIDRCIRLALGLTCVYYGFFESTFLTNHIVAPLIGLFGVLNLFAAALSFCPVYTVCGVSSLKPAPLNDAREHQG